MCRDTLSIIDDLGPVETFGGQLCEMLCQCDLLIDPEEGFACMVESEIMVVEVLRDTVLDADGFEKLHLSHSPKALNTISLSS